MEYKDYYQILGVAKDAGQPEIKKAYRRMARKYHPDLNKGNPAAETRFKEINEAHRVLSDPEKRRKYDQLGADWEKYRDFQGAPRDSAAGQGFEPGGTGFGGFQFRDFSQGTASGFSDFFRMFFGGSDRFESADDIFGRAGRRASSGRRAAAAPAPEASAELPVTVREAVTGTRKHLSLQLQTPCGHCGGQGMMAQGPCPACHGQGAVARSEEIEVTIPAGVQNGSKIRLGGKDRPASGGLAGQTLYLSVKITEDPLFHLRGRNVHCDIPVTVYEAVLGAEIDVPTATGRVRMRIPPETKNSQTFRLKGKGLPALGRHPAGDQIIRIRVELPHNLSAREKDLFHELARLRSEDPRMGMN